LEAGEPSDGAVVCPEMQSPKLGYSPHIDGLRAVAVAAVIVFHAFPSLLPGGFVGVDVFFVISGFLISSILYREFSDRGSSGLRVIGNFYARRIRRIFPALIVVLLACYVLGYYLLLPSGLSQLSLRITASAGFFLNLILSRDVGYFKGEAASNPLIHLWSLSVEEQFYVIWPLAIWIASRCRARFLPVAVFFGAASYFWNGHRITSSAESAFFLLQTRVWDVSVGAVVADLYPRLNEAFSDLGCAAGRWRSVSSNALSLAGLCLLGLGFWLIRGDPFYPDHWALLPTLGTALVICSGADAWVNRHLLSRPSLVGVGLISYPLYLWHWPLLSYVHLAFPDEETVRIKIALVCGALGLAWLTYRFVENPIRHRHKSWIQPFLLLATMAAVANVGLYTYRQRGIPSRFPRIVQEASDLHYPYARLWREGTNFLDPNQEGLDFKDDPRDFAEDRPTLYLWGDSHAAALYPGFRACYGKVLNIIQRTTAGVPPMLGVDVKGRPARRAINEFILASVKKERPKYVVLAGNWPDCKWEDLGKTIRAIKEVGVPHVIIVGPVPEWTAGLPQQICNFAIRHPSQPVPMRLNSGLQKEPIRIDPLLRAIAEQSGAEYVSPCAILGSNEGYLVRLGDSADSLTTFDYGHLTETGAIYVVSHFPKL
jgi:peptidoglycan/LPS O-acetylase OafA/YrhL